jgi:hypothetical protein
MENLIYINGVSMGFNGQNATENSIYMGVQWEIISKY